jgi:hypothetical protein
MHHKGLMVGAQETIFHWARVLQLTIVVNSVVVFIISERFYFLEFLF